jgi:hypothetical protein
MLIANPIDASPDWLDIFEEAVFLLGGIAAASGRQRLTCSSTQMLDNSFFDAWRRASGRFVAPSKFARVRALYVR